MDETQTNGDSHVWCLMLTSGVNNRELASWLFFSQEQASRFAVSYIGVPIEWRDASFGFGELFTATIDPNAPTFSLAKKVKIAAYLSKQKVYGDKTTWCPIL